MNNTRKEDWLNMYVVVERYTLIQFIFPCCQSSFCGKQTGKKLVTSVLSSPQGAVLGLSS